MKERKEIINISASVKERLRNISNQTQKEFQSVLRQYIQERFLFRLSKSKYSNNLILKGALLFIAHNMSRNRPTKDIDFLGTSVPNSKDEISEIIKDILKIKSEDGIQFDSTNIDSENITEGGDYQGVRVKFYAYLENSRERIQIDVGFGDRIIGGPIEIEFPTLLDFPAPKLRVYSVESAVAEKFEAIVSLQLETSRMKDFYDILYFAENYEFKMDLLKKAILTTFNHRETDVELRKNIYEERFKSNEVLQKYWVAFLSRNKLVTESNFPNIIEKLKSFIEPIFLENKFVWNPSKFGWEK
ncbi:MAG TPA: nucleotidyl transferase AbiEii/AbiGii toxin family protein [Ignavibacteriaceae bacterium]|nr:nucleotidyl transferase AbiEii/AbiGii toxin family protein [Ignavibacteriaceae bacterium]